MLPKSNCSSASTKTVQKKRVEMQCDLSGVKRCIITLIKVFAVSTVRIFHASLIVILAAGTAGPVKTWI